MLRQKVQIRRTGGGHDPKLSLGALDLLFEYLKLLCIFRVIFGQSLISPGSSLYRVTCGTKP